MTPHDPALHADLGRIYRQAGNLKNAVAAFRQSLRLAARSFDLLCDLAATLSEKGELAAAAEAYTEALEVRPDAIDIRIQLGEVLLAANRPADAATALERAGRAPLRSRHPPEARFRVATHRPRRRSDGRLPHGRPPRSPLAGSAGPVRRRTASGRPARRSRGLLRASHRTRTGSRPGSCPSRRLPVGTGACRPRPRCLAKSACLEAG